MKRIIIIGEGQTEQSFCNDVLQPHFSARGIFIQNPISGNVLYGSLLASEIGLVKIRAKCPRFNDWITKLEVQKWNF
jgi:hypothetical protein